MPFSTTSLISFNRTALPGDVAGRWNLLTTFLYPAPKSIGGFTYFLVLFLLKNQVL
jgi:hypothetical protein